MEKLNWYEGRDLRPSIDDGWEASPEYQTARRKWKQNCYGDFDQSPEFHSARLAFKNRVQRLKD